MDVCFVYKLNIPKRDLRDLRSKSPLSRRERVKHRWWFLFRIGHNI